MSKVKYEKSKKIEFSREYMFNGELKNHLIMREPTIGDEINAQEMARNENEMQLLMFANLCDISIDELKPIASKDGAKIAEAYQDFLS
jgi:hypothetical protein